MNRRNLVLMVVIVLMGTLAGIKRDPTRPMQGKATGGILKVEGTFITRTKRMALISGRYYVLGDKVGDGVLVGILSDRIVIKNEDGMQVYQLIKKVRKP
jgi:hypothetical protein